MRIDMAKVVTEKPRRGHGNPSKKWGRRLGKNEHDAEDHGPTRAPIARRHQYGWNAKEFSDLLGPLRRYLRKQVGRPWKQGLVGDRSQSRQPFTERPAHLRPHPLGGGAARLAQPRRESAPHSLVGTRPSQRLVRSSDYGIALLPARVLARISRRPVPQDKNCASRIRHRRLERSGDSTLPRRHHASVGAAGLRLVHSQLSLRARTTRSSHHPQRWSRRAGLRVTALRTRRNKAGEQERDP
jgi:hypothetical protein